MCGAFRVAVVGAGWRFGVGKPEGRIEVTVKGGTAAGLKTAAT